MIRFVVVLLLMAAVLYGVFWAIERRDSGDQPRPARPLPRGPIGPDDDEAFLRNLNSNPPAPPTDSQETHDHPE